MKDLYQPGARREEEAARQIIQRELNRKVIIYDKRDGTSKPDLLVIDAPEIAIEVTGAVDEKLTKTWNTGPARDPLQLPVEGDWVVTIASGTRISTLKQDLRPILETLESQELRDLQVDYRLQMRDAALFDELNALGINGVFRSLPGSGKVYLEMPRVDGGPVDIHGSSIPQWVGRFLRDDHRTDVLSKLKESGKSINHVFIWVEAKGAPWSVESYMSRELKGVPEQAPDLPSPVTGVWLASTHGYGKGLRWDGRNWRVFSTREDEPY